MVVGLQNIVSFKPSDDDKDSKAGGGSNYPPPPCDYNETLIWCVNQVYEAAECVWLSTLDIISLGMMFYLFKRRIDYTGNVTMIRDVQTASLGLSEQSDRGNFQMISTNIA